MIKQLAVSAAAVGVAAFAAACDAATPGPSSSPTSTSTPSVTYEAGEGAYQDTHTGPGPYPNWPDISGANCEADVSFTTTDGNHHSFVCVNGQYARIP